MASDVIRKSHVEVEQKFKPTDLLQAQLEGRYGEYERLRKLHHGSNAVQQSGALSFFRLPDKEIRDVYIDYRDGLAKKGVCIRHRTTKTVQTLDFPLVNDGKPVSEWEGKLRMGGHDTSTQMLKASGRETVKYIATIYLPDVEVSKLVKTAELRTKRKTYVVQKPFGWLTKANREGEICVALDEISADEGAFEHFVGEVEMTAEVVGGETDEEHDLLRWQQVARMQVRMDEFVARHALLYPKNGVKGKLEAFFEWKGEQAGSFV